ncbi:MAG: NarK/NasA family nitrate transporter [Hydrogenophilales bacterium]|nr:NarK/NasA family nitrate transporter [Hydrogenophilales bacterium]
MTRLDGSVHAARSEPTGNLRVLWISFLAFSLGFAIWGMFAALGPFLIKWYHFSPTQALILAAMPPFFATAVSIPLGILADRFGGRLVFTLLLLSLCIPLFSGLFAESYLSFLFLGMMLGLGGASFVVGNAHVSSWYPRSKQGTALGIFGLGNIGIGLGMVAVAYLITHVLGGPAGYEPLPARFTFGVFSGWRLIFLIFAIPTLLMALAYWFFTSDSPHKQHKGVSLREVAAVYRSGKLVWLVTYLYWTAFGTLTFFAATMPTYLVDQWQVDTTQASMVYTALLVVCVAVTRPLGGWLADRYDALKMLGWMFGAATVLALLMALQISLAVELFAIYALALLSGASAASVVKLIPTYFKHVGAVSGLAKAAGAACGFTMTVTLAASKHLLGGYTAGFVVWALMNATAFYIAYARVGFRHARTLH